STADDDKKPQKEHKFCLLPPKDSKGDRDPAWIRVWMEGVDEVGAHENEVGARPVSDSLL
ncbi:hypothetical protein KC317_g1242, partial [Hortaea werneckii]